MGRLSKQEKLQKISQYLAEIDFFSEAEARISYGWWKLNESELYERQAEMQALERIKQTMLHLESDHVGSDTKPD